MKFLSSNRRTRKTILGGVKPFGSPYFLTYKLLRRSTSRINQNSTMKRKQNVKRWQDWQISVKKKTATYTPGTQVLFWKCLTFGWTRGFIHVSRSAEAWSGLGINVSKWKIWRRFLAVPQNPGPEQMFLLLSRCALPVKRRQCTPIQTERHAFERLVLEHLVI